MRCTAGLTEEGLALLQESLDLAQELGTSGSPARSSRNSPAVNWRLASADRALSHTESALQMCSDVGMSDLAVILTALRRRLLPCERTGRRSPHNGGQALGEPDGRAWNRPTWFRFRMRSPCLAHGQHVEADRYFELAHDQLLRRSRRPASHPTATTTPCCCRRRTVRSSKRGCVVDPSASNDASPAARRPRGGRWPHTNGSRSTGRSASPRTRPSPTPSSAGGSVCSACSPKLPPREAPPPSTTSPGLWKPAWPRSAATWPPSAYRAGRPPPAGPGTARSGERKVLASV